MVSGTRGLKYQVVGPFGLSVNAHPGSFPLQAKNETYPKMNYIRSSGGGSFLSLTLALPFSFLEVGSGFKGPGASLGHGPG